MRPLASAWTADQETNSKGEKLLELHSNDEKVTGEEEKGIFIEYLFTEQGLVFNEKRSVHSRVLKNRIDELVSKRKRAKLRIWRASWKGFMTSTSSEKRVNCIMC